MADNCVSFSPSPHRGRDRWQVVKCCHLNLIKPEIFDRAEVGRHPQGGVEKLLNKRFF